MISVFYFDEIDPKKAKLKAIKNSKILYWQVKKEFFCFNEEKHLEVEIENQKLGMIIPSDFYSDGINLPFISNNFNKKIITAAFYHDFLYDFGNGYGLKRKTCDKIFLLIMKKYKVNKILRNIFYYGVRFFGFKNYKNN